MNRNVFAENTLYLKGMCVRAFLQAVNGGCSHFLQCSTQGY